MSKKLTAEQAKHLSMRCGNGVADLEFYEDLYNRLLALASGHHIVIDRAELEAVVREMRELPHTAGADQYADRIEKFINAKR